MGRRQKNWKEMEKIEKLIQIVAESNRPHPNLDRIKRLVQELHAPPAERSLVVGYYGIALFKHDKVKEAIRYLAKAVRVNPALFTKNQPPGIRSKLMNRYRREQALFHFYLARCYFRMGNQRLASRHLAQAQRLDAGNPQYREYRFLHRKPRR